ncbi:L-fucose mutarotase [bacterium]|jgi:L-fucose mutarotase|nr:L-fucose mutarotase [bacterium]MDC0276335.1 L-fucose mutarotase [Verrucomicrobiales bacterium]MDC0322832.1 L-fucose mutarotase [Verrucomicrobiales bacterium]
MLKGISPLLSPELLATLCRMGHGDTIILADAHFPGESVNANTLRADGLLISDLLAGILPLFELDSYLDGPVAMMAPVEGDEADPSVEESYRKVIDELAPGTPPIEKIERFAFYEAAKSAFAVVMTGDTGKYGNLLLTKGVTPS